jgi:hypothetical protein
MKVMTNVFKTRWFKFILRTLLDWAVFVFIVIVWGLTINSTTPIDINYYSLEDHYSQRIEELEDSVKKMQHKLDLYEDAELVRKRR